MTEPKIRKGKITEFTPMEYNPNKHTERGYEALERSMGEVGYVTPMTATADGEIIDGNARLEKSGALLGDDVIIIESDGTRPIVHVRTDIHADSDKARRIGILANRVAELNLAWNPDVIMRELSHGTMLADLWTDEEFKKFFQAVAPDEEPESAAPNVDYFNQVHQAWKAERGQIWEIPSLKRQGAAHRLMCGDSYDEKDVAGLLNGRTPDLLHTDPPYGIRIVKEGRTSAEKNLPPGFSRGGANHGTAQDRLVVQPNFYPMMAGDDQPFDPAPFLNYAPKVILWGANNYADKLPTSGAWYVWDKRENITRNDFSDCELAWTNVGNGARCFHHLWNGLHKASQHGERRLHPTEKPVMLFQEINNIVAPGRLWLDLFMGSGAQMVAAERNSAICLGMEIEPIYVSITLERLKKEGLAPVRLV